MELIAELRNMGIEVALEGKLLKLTPQDKITPEILQRVKANKKEIAESLKRDNTPKASFYLIDGKEQAFPKEDFPLIKELPYVCLKSLPPTALLLYSRVLDERIWLVTSPDLIERLQATGKVIYVLEEILRLMEQGLTDPDSVKAIHAVKSGFPGSMVQ